MLKKVTKIVGNPLMKTVLGFGIIISLIYVNIVRNAYVSAPVAILKSTYTVTIDPYSLSVLSGKTNQPLVRISPLDDWIYRGEEKKHPFEKPALGKKQDELSFVKNVLGHQKVLDWNVTWKSSVLPLEMNYTVVSRGRDLLVRRRLREGDLRIAAIGQSIRICNFCFISDEEKRVYFDSNLLTDQKLEIAKKIEHTPVILSKGQTIPFTTRKVTVRDAFGKAVFSMPIGTGQEIYFDEEFSLLEIKAVSPSGGSWETLQIIEMNI